jgi:hypothetical protein
MRPSAPALSPKSAIEVKRQEPLHPLVKSWVVTIGPDRVME